MKWQKATQINRLFNLSRLITINPPQFLFTPTRYRHKGRCTKPDIDVFETVQCRWVVTHGRCRVYGYWVTSNTFVFEFIYILSSASITFYFNVNFRDIVNGVGFVVAPCYFGLFQFSTHVSQCFFQILIPLFQYSSFSNRLINMYSICVYVFRNFRF